MVKHRPLPLLLEELETRWMFAIELDIVALHEFGHALGLAHYADTAANSIMEAFYNANYNKNNLSTDVAVTVNGSDGYSNLMELFSDAKISANTTSWKDSLDGNQNGTVNVTYSFMPDNTRLENNKRSNLFSAMASDIGPPATWQALFAEELQRWASVSSNNLSFSVRSDNGANSGTGLAQADPGFGDIRIGGHRFDGKGGVLAHCYYPPPNGGSFAGDAHFASEEDWLNGDPLTVDGAPKGRFARLVQTPEGTFFQCTFGEDHHHADELTAHSDAEDSAATIVAGGFLANTEASAVVGNLMAAESNANATLPIDKVVHAFSLGNAETSDKTAKAEESVWAAYNAQVARIAPASIARIEATAGWSLNADKNSRWSN